MKNEILQPGDKCKYLYGGKWQKGVVHGVKTHEEPNGIITRIAYLVDTGKVVREDITKVHPTSGKVLETVKQPEQVEVEAFNIKLA